MSVLALNVGSSSLKYALFAGERELMRGEVDGAHDEAVSATFAKLDTPPDIVGHRLVHGGPHHLQPERITPALLAALHEAIPFAPLHLPAQLSAIAAVSQRFPRLPQVACFDTAFHAAMPEVAQRFALPRALHDQGVHKYGFHGLSYEYVTQALALTGRAVIAHLGSGASLCAVRDGVSVDTTMGLTPTGGIMMSTRSGDLDPSVVLYAQKSGIKDVEHVLNHESGLLGVSGTSGDMKTLLARNDPASQLAVEMFAYQVRKTIGAFAAAMGGIDTLVFTGGIGERAASVRARCCEGLAHLGIVLDPAKSESTEIASGTCRVCVITTNEELMIARHTQRLG